MNLVNLPLFFEHPLKSNARRHLTCMHLFHARNRLLVSPFYFTHSSHFHFTANHQAYDDDIDYNGEYAVYTNIGFF